MMAIWMWAMGMLMAWPVGYWLGRRARRMAEDERAELLAMGISYGIDPVPGESLSEYRRDVIRERDRRAAVERRHRS